MNAAHFAAATVRSNRDGDPFMKTDKVHVEDCAFDCFLGTAPEKLAKACEAGEWFKINTFL